MMSRVSAAGRRLPAVADARLPGATEVVLRLRFGSELPQLGPGKIALMEHIAREGSISAASRAMHMSYHRATTIVGEINAMFRAPLVATQLGGTKGGGATITPLGHDIVRRYRLIEQSVRQHAHEHVAAIEASIVPTPPSSPVS